MGSRHLVDPELAPILEAIPEMDISSPEKIAATRAIVAQMTELALADPDRTVAMSEHIAPGVGDNPAVSLRLYRPEGLKPNAPVIFHIHGGGYMFGSAASSDPRHRQWAKTLNCAVASVDYRLAPETPFPGAIADCYAALLWLHTEAPKLGLDRTKIALAGESAGGGLAAALALTIRDRGGPKPCFQLLIYPMIDDHTGTADKANAYAGEFVWDRAGNREAWRAYLGTEPGVGEISSHAAAARATDLAGLPPAFIGTGALDLFIDENLDYARRLSRAGVPVELYCAPGAFHGFDALAPAAKVAQRFNDIALNALRRAFSG